MTLRVKASILLGIIISVSLGISGYYFLQYFEAEAIPKMAVEQKNAAVVDDILKTYFSILPKFENGMFILDAKGTLWADYPQHSEVRGRSFAFRPYFQETMA
jgi:hypothetical protein